MKKLFVLLWVVGLIPARADDTNKFEVLVCKNASYTNAAIIRANPIEVVVDFDGGIERVSLTNLPDSLHDKYPYDPKKAAEYLAAEKQKESEQKEAAQAQRIANMQAWEELAKNAQTLTISDYDGGEQCRTFINGKTCEITVKNLPKSLKRQLQYYYMIRADDMSSTAISRVDGNLSSAESGIYRLADDEKYKPTIRAFYTGQTYYGYQVWYCVQ
jgi:hypothetical protein